MKIGLDCPYCRQGFCLCHFDDTLPTTEGVRLKGAACPGCGCLFCRCPPPALASPAPPTSNIRLGRDSGTEGLPVPLESCGPTELELVHPELKDGDGEVTAFYAEDVDRLERNIFAPVEWV